MATSNPQGSITGTIVQSFSGNPYLNQVFDQQIDACLKLNASSNCVNPPSIAQMNSDINYINSIISDIQTNGITIKESEIFVILCQAQLELLKNKKCIYDQYPCFGNDQYIKARELIFKFKFFNS